MVNLPVYFDLNGIHQVSIFSEQEDGSFRRTMEQPIRSLRENITGIGAANGQLLAARYCRGDFIWTVPTVVYHSRSYSYYQFMREQLLRWTFPVFSCPSMQGHVARFTVHELMLKPGVSRQVLSLVSKKFVDSLNIELENPEPRETPLIDHRIASR